MWAIQNVRMGATSIYGNILSVGVHTLQYMHSTVFAVYMSRRWCISYRGMFYRFVDVNIFADDPLMIPSQAIENINTYVSGIRDDGLLLSP